ncbi:MAG: SpoIID/LytB domain-containing protein [Candidatus Eisenbacteria bacterium]|nr:SpoIID/LytB domain-containing protein [Candidatus Eisenbacteria bacterium]
MKKMWAVAALLLSTWGCAAMRQGLEQVETGARGEPWIRVGLAWDVSSVELTSDRDMLLRLREPRGERERVPREIGRELRVTAEGGLGLSGGQGYRETLPGEDTLVVDFRNRPLESRFTWRGHHYAGRLMIFRNARSTFTVVNVLPLERYLAGVVPAEIGRPGADGAQAVRAQAVAARSYTLFYLGRRAAEGFDVYGNVEDQVYGGLDAEDAYTTAQVEATRGMVLASDGRAVRAMYSSSCGGMLAALDEAFPSPAQPYLVPHRDRSPDLEPAESFCGGKGAYRWREEWTMEQFESALAEFGPPDLRAEDGQLRGRVLDVRVAGRSPSGRVKRLEIETTAGTFGLEQMRLRATLRRPTEGRPILRSTLFKIGVDYEGDTPVKVVAQGAGNGHGVGMCQLGARGMSARGYLYEQILLHYYRGAQLERWYD